MSQAVFNFITDKPSNRIRVERSFQAPLDLVWSAWTEADLLDRWWAPKPYRAETKSLNFTVGGQWLYCMIGPEGDRHWCLFNYESIEQQKRYSGYDAFCDETGAINQTKPRVDWNNEFASTGPDSTMVTMHLQFQSLADLETIIQMGFKEGFTMGMENLDEYIAAQFYLRRQMKTTASPRVSTYVNFPGNTEEAFRFYQSVFGTAFIHGIQRFGDIPADPGQPPMSDKVKNLVLHVELPLLGGHVLMGTDAPKEMGFTVTPGNNMHINLEPDSREEANRIFHALAEGGSISMPIQDMFWGAYFGSLTDRFGINWMVNHQTKENQ